MCSLRTAGLSQPPMVTSFPTLQLGKTSWPLVSPMHLQHYSEGVAVKEGRLGAQGCVGARALG